MEKSIMGLNIRSEGCLSLNDAYHLTYSQRELYVKLIDQYNEEKQQAMNRHT